VCGSGYHDVRVDAVDTFESTGRPANGPCTATAVDATAAASAIAVLLLLLVLFLLPLLPITLECAAKSAAEG